MVVAETRGAGQGRSRAHRRRLRDAHAGHRYARQPPKPARRGSTIRSANVCVDADVGDVDGDQGGLRARGPRREARHLGASRHRRAARRPRRDRRLRSGDQQAHAARRLRRRGAAEGTSWPRILGVPAADVRVECGDVGGNFGTRNAFYPEFALVVWAAKRLGRPVKWTCERSEAFASDYQGRDQVIDAGARARRQGQVPGRARLGDLQHRRAQRDVRAAGEMQRSCSPRSIACRRRIIRARAALSNTPPTSPYRSAGRPEAMFAIERLIDVAATAVRLSTASICAAATSFRRRRSPTPTRSA